MKKFIVAAVCAAIAAILPLTGCNTQINYSKYISEKRSKIYLYNDDNIDITVHCVSREQPYNADGICGNMCDIVEIFIKFSSVPKSVEIAVGDYWGEMNYEAVQTRFTASYSAPPFKTDGIDVTITVDGVQNNYRLLSVSDSGVLSCEQALKCAVEHDRELFKSLTRKKDFAGEIYVRLLYDDGCYYYVGVCDRDKNITAYLLDGGIGKVIATKKIKA